LAFYGVYSETKGTHMETKDAYSILEFCQRHGLSRSAFYNAVKAQQGPRLMKVGNRVMISRESAEQWRREREIAAPQSAA
jgi:predicted DNA-binding transcriptional regulator AlpA